MSKIEFTVALEATNGEQLIAASNFLTALAALQGVAPTKVQSTPEAKAAETESASAETAPDKEEPKAPVRRNRSSKAAKAEVAVDPDPKAEEVESPAAEAAKEEAPEKEETGIKVETLRALLSKKVDNNRDVIKDKLTEFGTKNITGLDVKHYQDMYDFLNTLD